MMAKKDFFIAGLIVFVLNMIWEFSHYSLYIDLSGIPKYSHLVVASIADAVIILCIFVVVSLKNKNFDWVSNSANTDYLLVVFLGLAIAFFIEIINLNLERWEYAAAMPTIFGVGTSPLIQLAVTGIFSLIILRYVKG